MRLSARTIAARRANTGASGSGILTDINLLPGSQSYSGKARFRPDEPPLGTSALIADFCVDSRWCARQAKRPFAPQAAAGAPGRIFMERETRDETSGDRKSVVEGKSVDLGGRR